LNHTQRWILFALTVANPGIFFVDSIHFQYNGFMYGLQLLSVAFFAQSRFLLGGAMFATVLNFKHIYMYQGKLALISAPPYFIFLLSAYCFKSIRKKGQTSFSLIRLIQIGVVTLSVFAVSIVPFHDQLPQLLSRLFPFKRGLCHAYWAPNVWALYSFADRLLFKVMTVLLKYKMPDHAHLTRGLVGDTSFAVLPNITPLMALMLTVGSQLVCPFNLSLFFGSYGKDLRWTILSMLWYYLLTALTCSHGMCMKKPFCWS
jgi:alpha-1,3-glucosyltransferase